jgi:elongation factor Ts
MAALYVEEDKIPAEVLEAKKAELLQDESVQKKPEHIRGQIIEGQLKKWFSQVCLYDQPFRDEERTVRELIQEKIATIGENIRVRRFTRYALGEEL